MREYSRHALHCRCCAVRCNKVVRSGRVYTAGKMAATRPRCVSAHPRRSAIAVPVFAPLMISYLHHRPPQRKTGHTSLWTGRRTLAHSASVWTHTASADVAVMPGASASAVAGCAAENARRRQRSARGSAGAASSRISCKPNRSPERVVRPHQRTPAARRPALAQGTHAYSEYRRRAAAGAVAWAWVRAVAVLGRDGNGRQAACQQYSLLQSPCTLRVPMPRPHLIEERDGRSVGAAVLLDRRRERGGHERRALAPPAAHVAGQLHGELHHARSIHARRKPML